MTVLNSTVAVLTYFLLFHSSYEHETGRESALEMLASMFSSFPEVRNHFHRCYKESKPT